jgi:hypothetical protein
MADYTRPLAVSKWAPYGYKMSLGREDIRTAWAVFTTGRIE